MSYIFQTTSINVSSGSYALFMQDGDTLQVGAGVYLVDTVQTGVYSTGPANLINQGLISGVNGFFVVNSVTTGSSYIYNATSGIISAMGGEAIDLSVGPFDIVNYGQIEDLPGGADSLAIGSAGSGVIYNYGSITGKNALYDADSTLNDNYTLYNYGTITGTTAAFQSGGGVDNERIVNDGVINGNVDLGNGAGSSFDSTNGQIDGLIASGTGGGFVIGGVTGGTIDGSIGNDIFYSNPTQTAANNAAHTTMDAYTGDNYEYGGSAYTTFDSGDNVAGDFNLIVGELSKMSGVSGYANNTVSYGGLAASYKSVFVNLAGGYAYMSTNAHAVSASPSQLTFEDYIQNTPNVIGSAGSDVVECDNGVDVITAGSANKGGDVFYAGSGAASQDTFVFTSLQQSPLTNAAAVEGFKIGVDKIDLSHLNMPSTADFGIVYGGNGDCSILVETNPAAGFNAATDMIISVAASTNATLTLKDLIL
jgi:hypothetical protein